ETDAANLEPFATVTPLGDLPSYEAGRLLLQMARSADLILNAHSLLGYELLGELRAAGNAQQLAYLHVIDTDPFGLPAGYPVWAARQHEGQLDLMIVPSRALRSSLLNLGVPDEKVCIAPNAPAFAPSSLEAGLVLAEEKARRTADQDRPLRLLFAGRLDRQKGVTRLARAARQLSRRGFPYRLTILGKPVMDEE